MATHVSFSHGTNPTISRVDHFSNALYSIIDAVSKYALSMLCQIGYLASFTLWTTPKHYCHYYAHLGKEAFNRATHSFSRIYSKPEMAKPPYESITRKPKNNGRSPLFDGFFKMPAFDEFLRGVTKQTSSETKNHSLALSSSVMKLREQVFSQNPPDSKASYFSKKNETKLLRMPTDIHHAITREEIDSSSIEKIKSYLKARDAIAVYTAVAKEAKLTDKLPPAETMLTGTDVIKYQATLKSWVEKEAKTLRGITKIDLTGFKLATCETLGDFPQITEVILEGNPMCDIHGLQKLKSLKQVVLDQEMSTDPLEKLGTLHISDESGKASKSPKNKKFSYFSSCLSSLGITLKN